MSNYLFADATLKNNSFHSDRRTITGPHVQHYNKNKTEKRRQLHKTKALLARKHFFPFFIVYLPFIVQLCKKNNALQCVVRYLASTQLTLRPKEPTRKIWVGSCLCVLPVRAGCSCCCGMAASASAFSISSSNTRVNSACTSGESVSPST